MSRPVEEEAVIAVLRDHGIAIDDQQAAMNLAREVVVATERARRTGRAVRRSQCGAPTLDGWPCNNQRLPGNSGCRLHPHWRHRD
jgi:hypothetical protein